MKTLFAGGVLLLALSAHADPLCVYQARVSEADKTNSQGENLANGGVSVSTMAAIIRQDRANFHEFNVRDAEDESDCVFASKKNRATMESMLKKGDVSPSALQRIVNGNPLIRVEVYRDYVNVQIVDRSPPPRSKVR
ncbi:MAG TPA: hypothetical protein PLS67_12985 [Accumulibacter sp.]|jgi:hypothetical protein|nr:hypothetical protein [Accumulibacter sp.]HQC81410.1 hypothetical protein [Accumulibacter sp.]